MIGSKPHGGPEVEMLVVFSQDHFIDVYGIHPKDEDARLGIFDRRVAKLPRRLDAETGDERIAQPQERAAFSCRSRFAWLSYVDRYFDHYRIRSLRCAAAPQLQLSMTTDSARLPRRGKFSAPT
jgi:hypothetical protein